MSTLAHWLLIPPSPLQERNYCVHRGAYTGVAETQINVMKSLSNAMILRSNGLRTFRFLTETSRLSLGEVVYGPRRMQQYLSPPLLLFMHGPSSPPSILHSIVFYIFLSVRKRKEL